MKKTLFFILIFLGINICYGQELKHRTVDIELGLGITFGAVKFPDYEGGIGPCLKLEGRYNFKEFSVDVGLQIAQCPIIRDHPFTSNETDVNRVSSILLLGDYQFRKGKRINTYAGLGVGPVWSEDSNSTYACIVPRIGVKCFNHLNLYLDYKYATRADRHASLCLGFYF